MAFTTEQIENLERVIASAVAGVKSGEESVTYQSIKDMMEVLQTMKNDVAQNNNRRTLAVYSSGRK